MRTRSPCHLLVYIRAPWGEVRACPDETYETDDGSDPFDAFYWTEGNASCDCNRATMFAAAGGEEDPEVECGDDNYVLVKIVRVSDGVVLWDAENPDAPSVGPVPTVRTFAFDGFVRSALFAPIKENVGSGEDS